MFPATEVVFNALPRLTGGKWSDDREDAAVGVNIRLMPSRQIPPGELLHGFEEPFDWTAIRVWTVQGRVKPVVRQGKERVMPARERREGLRALFNDFLRRK